MLAVAVVRLRVILPHVTEEKELENLELQFSYVPSSIIRKQVAAPAELLLKKLVLSGTVTFQVKWRQIFKICLESNSSWQKSSSTPSLKSVQMKSNFKWSIPKSSNFSAPNSEVCIMQILRPAEISSLQISWLAKLWLLWHFFFGKG